MISLRWQRHNHIAALSPSVAVGYIQGLGYPKSRQLFSFLPFSSSCYLTPFQYHRAPSYDGLISASHEDWLLCPQDEGITKAAVIRSSWVFQPTSVYTTVQVKPLRGAAPEAGTHHPKQLDVTRTSESCQLHFGLCFTCQPNCCCWDNCN